MITPIITKDMQLYPVRNPRAPRPSHSGNRQLSNQRKALSEMAVSDLKGSKDRISSADRDRVLSASVILYSGDQKKPHNPRHRKLVESTAARRAISLQHQQNQFSMDSIAEMSETEANNGSQKNIVQGSDETVPKESGESNQSRFGKFLRKIGLSPPSSRKTSREHGQPKASSAA